MPVYVVRFPYSPQGVYVDECPLVDLLDEVVLEVELLEGVEVDEGAVLHHLHQVVVEAHHLEARHVAEGVARHGGDPVLVQRHALQVAHLAEGTGMEGCMRLNLVEQLQSSVNFWLKRLMYSSMNQGS